MLELRLSDTASGVGSTRLSASSLPALQGGSCARWSLVVRLPRRLHLRLRTLFGKLRTLHLRTVMERIDKPSALSTIMSSVEFLCPARQAVPPELETRPWQRRPPSADGLWKIGLRRTVSGKSHVWRGFPPTK